MTRTALALVLWLGTILPASALGIEAYDRLSRDDRTVYMVDLVDVVMKALYRDEAYDDYLQFRALFGLDNPSRISAGMIEFAENVDRARALKIENPARDIQLEDALIETLQRHGIRPPDDILTLMDDRP